MTGAPDGCVTPPVVFVDSGASKCRSSRPVLLPDHACHAERAGPIYCECVCVSVCVCVVVYVCEQDSRALSSTLR